MRVLDWIVNRCRQQAEAVKTPIGFLPTPNLLGAETLDLSGEAWKILLEVDPAQWLEAANRQTEFFSTFGDRFPAELRDEQRRLIQCLEEVKR